MALSSLKYPAAPFVGSTDGSMDPDSSDEYFTNSTSLDFATLYSTSLAQLPVQHPFISSFNIELAALEIISAFRSSLGSKQPHGHELLYDSLLETGLILNTSRSMEEEWGGNGTKTFAQGTPMADQLVAHHEDNRTEGIENNAREGMEVEIQHRQRVPTRTIYHQRRHDDDTLNSTRSLYDTQVSYLELHGRRYCGNYYMPNDLIEQTRLLMYNEIYYDVFGNRNTTVPLTNPQKVLDIGTGTGEWAMAMGEEYPEAEVVGTDIAKIQPNAHPLNVFFEIDDAEEEWTWAEDDFDLVHFRYMCGAFADWRKIYRDVFRCLKPGGWIEVVDFDDHHRPLQYFDEDSEAPRWLAAVVEGCAKAGRPRTVEHLKPEFLADLGFTDVRCTSFDIPLGPWRDNKDGQSMGKHFLVATLSGIESISMRVLSEQMGWEYSEITRICEAVRALVWKTALDTEHSKGMCFRVNVLTGRKPGWEDSGKASEDVSTPKTTMTMTETNK